MNAGEETKHLCSVSRISLIFLCASAFIYSASTISGSSCAIWRPARNLRERIVEKRLKIPLEKISATPDFCLIAVARFARHCATPGA